ncbi:Predicted dehydrogenase [Faunimonas pinastri]|uniref:Predicted dehydrogenase n=1 Tax=Faunimonas pinastri TaxID=1855383 RepID=A0A1H9IEU8_9HYPH|nr:Gfo/Idh/MocA family oxidoreductase [Faunimonas pinastri]SEQ73038.1 Predicted dehydrogenase [Faunimonas pinastri]
MALRAALVGCGAMSRAWLDAAKQIHDFEVVALVDLSREAAQARADQFGLTHAVIGTDLDAVLAETKPDILFDVVVPAARRNVVETAFRHGCHVLSEKPMADTMENARALLAAADETHRLHAIMQNRRYIDGVRRMRAFLDSGAIGKITSLHCDFFLGPHFGGFREEMKHVLLLDMAIHTFDAGRYVSARRPLAVYCHESNPSNSWYAQGAAATAIFEMEDHVVFTYRGSWCAEGLRTSWESQWRVIGETGTLTWDGEDTFKAEAVAATGDFFSQMRTVEVPPPPPEMRIGGHAGVIADFVEAVRAGGTPETINRENIQSLAMVFGAIESAETGRRVAIEIPEQT